MAAGYGLDARSGRRLWALRGEELEALTAQAAALETRSRVTS
jgi:hypothetical protein